MARAAEAPEPTEPLFGEIRHFALSSNFVSDGDVRFDATSYAQESFAALSALERSRLPLQALRERVARVYHPTENQPRSNFKRIWVGPGEGPPFLTGKQLTFFRPDKQKFLSARVKKLDEMMMEPGTILLSRSGTTGVPVLVGEWLSQFAITDDALRVFPGEAPTGYVYAYLASEFGRALMVRNEYGATVPHLEAKHVLSVPIPLLGREVEGEFHERILAAYALRDAANRALDSAELELYDLLGVQPFSDEDIEYLGGSRLPHAYALDSQSLADRFDATYHLPVARSAVHKLERARYPLVELGSMVANVDVAPRFARIYVEREFGTPLLQGSHLPQMYPLGLKYISDAMTKNLDRWIIEDGWVLITCSGTIGRVAVSTRHQSGWAASQHILRIVPAEKQSHAGYLALFFSTPFGQHQLRAKVYGGVVDELTAEDTAVLKVPKLPWEMQQAIGEKVRKAYELREEAAAVEQDAIADLESLIHQRGRMRVAIA